jgi:hypothetical protein
MAVYMIAYELHEGEDYEGDLIKAIKALPSGGSWHNLGSTWFVISKEAAVQIHNSLKRHVLDGDKLAVVQCGNLEKLVLRFCIRPVDGAFELLAIMDIRARSISFTTRPRRPYGPPDHERAGETFSPSPLSDSQTSAGNPLLLLGLA